MRMVLREGKTSGQIAEILTSEGFKLSQPTVSRYIKKKRKDIEPTVAEMVQDHVSKTVPKDLEAVETMEACALDWGAEEPETQAERLSAWEKILEGIEDWLDRIHDAKVNGPDALEKVIKAFAQRCLIWVIEDLDNKKGRMAAMKLASALIELKLKYSGLIDGEGKGSIFIMTSDGPKGPSPAPKDKQEGGLTLSLVGGER